MMMRMNAKVLVTAIAFVAMGLATASAQITREQLRTGSDEQLLREWTKVLASDEFGGRKPMTPYEDKTVDYLAFHIDALVVVPAVFGRIDAKTAEHILRLLQVNLLGGASRPDDQIVGIAEHRFLLTAHSEPAAHGLGGDCNHFKGLEPAAVEGRLQTYLLQLPGKIVHRLVLIGGHGLSSAKLITGNHLCPFPQ